MAHNPKSALNSSKVSSSKNREKKALSQQRAAVVTKTPSKVPANAVTVNDLPVVPTVAPTYNIKDSSNVTDVFSPQSLATFIKPASAKTGYRVSNPTLLAPGRSKAVTAPALKAYDLSVRPLPAYVAKTPAISVVVPLFNAEEYITECLESLLHQTFQDFEVIVVDDCSTDNSVQIVESYAPKFNGRLHIAHTETNSGGGGYIPRNIGFKLARGEYVIFIDSDDFILLTALETLYNAAKKYDAEVVYTGAYYDLKTPTDVYLYRDGEGKNLLKQGLKDKPVLRIDDSKGNLQRLMVEREGNFRGSWTKFCRRDFLLKNDLFFPTELKTSGDFIWVISVYCRAKRFLRIPTPFYFYRRNLKSVTLTEREPSEQISYLISIFVDVMKNICALQIKNKVLAENPIFCFSALRSHFDWFLKRLNDARKELDSQDIYAILYREFSKRNDLAYLDTVPFFFSFIDNERKVSNDSAQTVKQLEKERDQLKKFSALAVSVIIPMYNAAKYIGECLDSLLAQTFQNFEVIVVDDCSTDNSAAIVESYAPKFNGRLILSKTEENTGNAALPRNKGLTLSRGEYIQFVDADDMLTKTALEELYGLAKKHGVEVVCCEQFYKIDASGENKRILTYQRGKLVDKPTFESSDLKERVKRIIDERYLTVPWNKLVKRDLIMRNEIFFPSLKTSEDNIYTQGLVFYAKKFLRVPNIVNIYRQSEGSSQRAERTPQQTINFWLNPVILGLKALDALMNRHEFFKTNPSCRIDILKKFVTVRLEKTLESSIKLNDDAIYSTIKGEFGGKLGDYDVLISALLTVLYNEKKVRKNDSLIFVDKFKSYFTARIDLKVSSKGDFQILNISDEKANVDKPDWLQKNGTGYVITSCAGKLQFVAKADTKEKIVLSLRGMYVPDPKDSSKRLQRWIDYTKLTVNGKKLFDTVTPAWHDESYSYSLNVKAGEEAKISVEWLPHMNGNDKLTNAKLVEQAVLINALCALLQNEQNARKEEVQIIDKFSSYFTARIDLKLMPKTRIKGNFQILSMSDNKAEVSRPSWFQKNGKGYVISSYAGNLNFVAKSSVTGQISLALLGLDVRDPKNKSKRIPYWIDYTKLVINGKTIFDKLTPCWHNEPYSYNINVKAGDEIKIQVEWLPHRSDT